jgi:ribosomal protein S18 acetylase RimI-like enzyme
MGIGPVPAQILEVPPEDRQRALRLVFHRLGEEERRQQSEIFFQTPAGGPACGGLFGAYRGRQMVGASLGQPQPGRLAALWPPQLVSDEPQLTGLDLLRAVDQHLAAQGVQMAQALLGPEAEPDAEVLLQGGYVHLSDLLYLVCASGAFPAAEPATELEFEPWASAQQRRLAAIVEATYAETLDCPAVNGVRDVEDVLAGYGVAGAADPRRWLIVRHDAADVGCLILADYPQHDTWELVYMGVVRGARGRGWGGQIARHAQWLARLSGRSRLVLAVDAQNEPALAMYAAAGFQAWDRRAVYGRIYRRGKEETSRARPKGGLGS